MPVQAKFAWVAAIGLVIGCAGNHQHEDRDEEHEDEVKMSINDVPAAARETLRREAGGATITTVDKEQKHGKTVYETDVMLSGKNWEIVVDGSGKLVSKKLDAEEGEEKGGKKDKEDDDEKEEHEHKKHS